MESTQTEYLAALQEFYQDYIVETANGSFQVFQSFSYGEMVISFLLFTIIMLMVFRWIYEVVR